MINLKNYLNQNNIYIKDFASSLGVSKYNIYRWFRGTLPKKYHIVLLKIEQFTGLEAIITKNGIFLLNENNNL